jgi:hypothetical protein
LLTKQQPPHHLFCVALGKNHNEIPFRNCIAWFCRFGAMPTCNLTSSRLTLLTLLSKICLPDVFTVQQAVYLPNDKDVFITRNWFSIPQGKSRTDYDLIVEHGQDLHTKVSLLFDHKAVSRNTTYIIMWRELTVCL